MKTCDINELRYLMGTGKTRTQILAALALVLVAACGGSGGTATVLDSAGQVTSSPLLDTPPITIFALPKPQEYASVGAVTTDAGDGYASASKDSRISNILFGAASQPKIRYTAAGYYEIELPGQSFDRLIHYKGLLNPTTANNFFQPSKAAQNEATLIISSSRLQDYSDSELAAWTEADNRAGFLAFGVAAPAGALPLTGSATYDGLVLGIVDITYEDKLFGGYYFTGVTGTVALSVDFTSNSVTGSLMVSIDGAATRTYQIAPMVLDLSGNGVAGTFNAALAGYNQFTGLLSGPKAREAIGNWAVPVLIDGQSHQLFGAWIARRL